MQIFLPLSLFRDFLLWKTLITFPWTAFRNQLGTVMCSGFCRQGTRFASSSLSIFGVRSSTFNDRTDCTVQFFTYVHAAQETRLRFLLFFHFVLVAFIMQVPCRCVQRGGGQRTPLPLSFEPDSTFHSLQRSPR